MSLAVVFSRAREGVNAPLVTVEVHISNGLPGLSMVGLPEAAVKESKDRVRSALINSNFQFPAQRITVNLAPADLPKEGGRFDLPIAMGILAATGQVSRTALRGLELVGELSLSGELRPVLGVLPVAVQAKRCGRALVVPKNNAAEACLVTALQVYAADHLLEVVAHLNGANALPACCGMYAASDAPRHPVDFSEVMGQYHAKRALEIAAAGAHNLLMIGPPGTGKSMLAMRIPTVLPPLSDTEALESAAVWSVSDQGFDPTTWRLPKYRAPHHSASAAALVGGGGNPKPGEISLAHCGVLFLDEVAEFDRKVLEVLREPLETGRVTISRVARRVEYPARFQLVAAMNPCPCGYLGDNTGRCKCTPDQIQRYRNRLSGPLLDRIDMHIEVPRMPYQTMRVGDGSEEPSATIGTRVGLARDRMVHRQGVPNAAATAAQVQRFYRLEGEAQTLLDRALQRLGISHRAYHKVLKVARSIADLAGAETIAAVHVGEALGYRRLERPLVAGDARR